MKSIKNILGTASMIALALSATSDQAEEMLAYIRSIVAEKYGNEAAEETSILYGGSCKASNAPEALFLVNRGAGILPDVWCGMLLDF